MSIFDKFLKLRLLEDLTETPMWTDVVFQALEQDEPDNDGIDFEDGVAATQTSTKPRYQ